MQKAFKWLDARKIKYSFYDYKIAPPSDAMIKEWLKQIPIITLVNTRSTTYKNLSAQHKTDVLNTAKTITIIQENPSILKRPILDIDGKYIIGFDEEKWEKELEKRVD